MAVLTAACAPPSPPTSAPTSSAPAVAEVNPARIDRVRSALPGGYEVAAYTGPPVPMSVWGFTGPAVAEPPQCQALAAPAIDPATARGWSASGPGGIVYAVAGASPAAPDPAVLAECAQWTLGSERTTGSVTSAPAPDVDAAHTVAMSSVATTVVEGGTQTRTHAETFVAYLGDHVCFVALVTDPGSTYPALDPEFGAQLLAETVSAVRGDAATRG